MGPRHPARAHPGADVEASRSLRQSRGRVLLAYAAAAEGSAACTGIELCHRQGDRTGREAGEAAAPRGRARRTDLRGHEHRDLRMDARSAPNTLVRSRIGLAAGLCAAAFSVIVARLV